MSRTEPEIWIEAADGHDLVRADVIVMLRLDETGRLTAQLRDDARVSVPLLEGPSGVRPPDDFHRRLLRTIADLDDGDRHGTWLAKARRDGESWSWAVEPI